MFYSAVNQSRSFSSFLYIEQRHDFMSGALPSFHAKYSYLFHGVYFHFSLHEICFHLSSHYCFISFHITYSFFSTNRSTSSTLSAYLVNAITPTALEPDISRDEKIRRDQRQVYMQKAVRYFLTAANI